MSISWQKADTSDVRAATAVPMVWLRAEDKRKGPSDGTAVHAVSSSPLAGNAVCLSIRALPFQSCASDLICAFSECAWSVRLAEAAATQGFLLVFVAVQHNSAILPLCSDR